MDEIIKLLKAKPEEAITQLTQYQKPTEKIERNRKEYSELKRDNRDTQVGKAIKDKDIPASGNKPASRVIGNRVAVPFQKKIVTTSTAFEVGEKVVITPRISSNLSIEILRLWDVIRIDDKIQKLIEVKKSETESAIVFYIDKIDPDKSFNKILGPNKTIDIKAVVRTSKEGKMSIYKDSYGDMKAFVWQFTEKVGDKEIKKVWIYDDTKLYILDDSTGKLGLVSELAHGFSKIPVVYFEQDFPEWYDVEEMIDRFEVNLSKLGSANDYAGYPLLKLYGTLTSGMPTKDDDGKTLRFPVKERQSDGKTSHGDAEFLTMDNAPESVKLEMDTLEKLIYTLSNTPQLGLSELNGLGAISGIAIRLLFLDAIIKAKLNEGGNRTSIERILNVLISGTVTTTNASMKGEAENLFFDVSFKSILPIDFTELVEYLTQGVEAGVISKKTAVEKLALTGDSEGEIKQIETEKAAEPTKPTPTI